MIADAIEGRLKVMLFPFLHYSLVNGITYFYDVYSIIEN